MPVVHVRGLAPDGGAEQVDRALATVARDVAAAIDGDPSGTWCTFTALERMTIGEAAAEGEGRIVFVDLWTRSRGADTDADALRAACLAAAEGLDVPPADVWGTLRLVEPGQVFAGGDLITD